MPLSASQIAVYEADFRKFDVDGSGTLEMQDIAKMLTFQLQRQCTEDELQQYMAEVQCVVYTCTSALQYRSTAISQRCNIAALH